MSKISIDDIFSGACVGFAQNIENSRRSSQTYRNFVSVSMAHVNRSQQDASITGSGSGISGILDGPPDCISNMSIFRK